MTTSGGGAETAFDGEFISKTAADFGLNEQRLITTLLFAEEEHEVQVFAESGGEQFRECTENFRNVKTALNRADALFNDCHETEIEELELFRMTAFDADHDGTTANVKDQLAYLSDLFSSFEEFYRRGRGRPAAKSSDSNPVFLSALEEFARGLRDFWCEETGTRFGQHFAAAFESTDDDPETGTLVPANEASRFLCTCAKQLDRRYSPKHCKTVMRKLNEGSPQSFRK